MSRGGIAAGVVSVALSVLDASAQTARVTGRVTDSVSSVSLAGVTVAAVYPGGSNVAAAEAVTDATGQYSIDVAPGSYNLHATKGGFRLEWFDDVASSARSNCCSSERPGTAAGNDYR